VKSYRSRSFWLDAVAEAGDALRPRPSLAGDIDVDVVIVGAGYTGLWTAYYLQQRDPSVRVAVLEKEIAGFGASGRNGGWCSALFPASMGKVARESSPDAARAMQRAMRASIDEVGEVTRREGIDCDFAKGGTITLARTTVQLERAEAEVAADRELGLGDDDLELLDAEGAARHLRVKGVLGGLYTPHCAAIQPAKLARGLARVVEETGTTIYERTPALAIEPHRVRSTSGTVTAGIVVRATEGYTATIPGFRRTIAPVYSLMLATAPLPDTFWDDVGLSQRETFADLRHLIIYGQRTADNRLAFGGRGAPYHFGSRVTTSFDHEPTVFADLRDVLIDLFPALAGVEVTHTWGGPLGVPRDWFASVGLDRSTGLAWAGGYVGDGVATTNLAGRTLADLITEVDSALTSLPWVNHRSRRWEPEPLRWLGANATLRAMSWADAAEVRTGRASRLPHLLGRFLGE
jgi:glycine/D-amino acid oxidase-like deaminating enzyme